MQIVNWVVFVPFAVGWLWLTVRVLQWRDLHADRARARQDPMGAGTWVKTNAIAAIPQSLIWGVFLVGLAVLAWLVWQAPWAITSAGSAAVLYSGWKQPAPERDDITRLRAALADIMKTDQPPRVTVDGDTLRIAGHPAFREYQKAPRDAMEQAIEYRLSGDWELDDWGPDGSSTWSRVIHPPTRVDYTRHYGDLPWHQIPLGVDGAGQVRVMDLLANPHWMIAGNTRNGKTSILRVASAHLLHHGIEVAGIDAKGGLSFLRDRQGVKLVATRDIDKMTAALKVIRDEVLDRLELFDRIGRYRKPLVAEFDEVATACIWAGGENSDFAKYLLDIIRLGGQVHVFLLLSTQRPAAKAIPIEIRGQAEGRVAVGPMEPEVAMMMFEQEWVKAVELRKVKGSAILGDMSGQDNAEVQSFWLADPHDTDHPKAERDLADSLLPPVAVRHADTEGVASDESGATHQVETKSKREPPNGTTDGATNAASAPEGVAAEETPWQRHKRLKRESAARYRENLPKRLLDPNDSIHGTVTGRAAGCLCEPCKTLTPRSKVPA